MKYKSVSTLIVLAVLIGGLAPMAMPVSSNADWSKVDPRVLDQMAIHGQTEFYAILGVQADVSGAARLATKEAKGAYVFNLLRDTARQTQAPLLRYLDQHGVSYRAYYIINAIHVKAAGQSTLDWLAGRADVAKIVSPPDPKPEPTTKSRAPDTHVAGIEWNVSRIHAPEAWAMGFHGEGMVVGDNDTGAEYTHPAVVNRYRGNLGGGTFDHNYNWWDAWGGAPSPTPTDYDGHGTHTLGTMIGDDGGSNQIGVAPGAQWIACAGLNLECLEFFLAPWDLTGNNPEPDKAPDSVNNSWYDTSGFDFRPIVQNLNASGVAVIKSAGNWGSACDTISPPGNVPEIIATAAFAQGDTIADFSSRGPSDDYGTTILKPEVAAPGVNVRSSYPGGGYTLMDGTSMAAPHSTAMVALIWSAAPCLRGDVPTTKQIMMDTAEPKVDAQCAPFVGHPNDVWGWGILDAEAAVQYAIGYCGGLGGLEGTVTSGGSPLQGVSVQATGAGGFARTAVTGADGMYAMAVLSDTYTVEASLYGYEPVVVTGVEVVTDVTTTVDIEMSALPEHTVSGYVRETGSNTPLSAVVEFTDAPVPPVNTDPSTGFYSVQVAEGTWHLQATAALHTPATVEVVVDGDVTQNFYLDPLPCILLVDDDTGDTYETWYANSLAALGYEYVVWNVATQGSPTAADLASHGVVIWLTGDDYSTTLTDADQAALAAFLNGGGALFISGQDIGYDINSSAFYANYMHASYIADDTNVLTLAGTDIMAGADVNIGGGDGANNQNYPSAIGLGAGAVGLYDYTGTTYTWGALRWEGDYRLVYLAFGFEAINSAASRNEVMSRVLDYLGGCACEPVAIVSTDAQADGCEVTFSAVLEGDAPFSYDWDFGEFGVSADPQPLIDFGVSGTYPYTLTVANCAGASTDVTTGTVTVECAPPCDEVVGVSLSALTLPPVYPGDPVDVRVDVEPNGAAAPFGYTVDGGPAQIAPSEPFTVTVTFDEAGMHAVQVAVWNCAMAEPVIGTLDVLVAPMYYVYLPIVAKETAGGK